MAKRLVRDGFGVVLPYAGKPAPAQALVAELKTAGGQAISVQADVASVPDVERLFQESIDAFGNLAVVVHSAGIMLLSLISAGDVETFDKVITTNRMDAMAVSYAAEPARWNIETVIIVPGACTSGTNHFAHAGKPEDKARTKEYEAGPTATLAKDIMDGFARTAAPDADVSKVAKAVVDVVDMSFGHRPFRVHIDPTNDGAEIVNAVADRLRSELLRNMGLVDLLKPASSFRTASKKAS